jgi:two-component system chemotaxis response regulator CheY
MSKQVLAIDDSLTIRELVSFVLVGAGYQVELGEDGEDGLTRFRQGRHDLVITDINMPRMNGLAFIERAREDVERRATPILVLSTESDPEKKSRARAAGANGWIIKPFNPQRLLDAVRRIAP